MPGHAPIVTSSGPRSHGLGRAMPAIAALLTAAAVLAVMTVVVVNQESIHGEELTAAVVREGSRMRADLERAVDVRISRTEGLVGFATAEAAEGDIDADLFALYAQYAAAETDVPLRSLQLAPEAVVTHIYPLEGNEAAIGHDLMADPDRRAAVEATVAARRTMVAGPFELLQGGFAIVARAPVFIPTPDGGETWWGLATVVADLAPLLDEANITVPGYDLALRGIDGLGAEGGVFHGDPDLFEASPELFDVTLPTGSWQLALVPAGGWDASGWVQRTPTVWGFVLLALLLGALVWRVVASRTRMGRLVADRAELISTANVPIVQVTAVGHIEIWNKEAERLTDVPATAVIGTRLDAPDVAEGSLRFVIDELRRATIESGDRIEGHLAPVQRRDGSVVELMFNTGPVTDTAGQITDVVVVAQDVTARAEADRVRGDNAALAEAARLKDEFLASMSHELRTPLNGILGLTTLLRAGSVGDLNEAQSTYVGHAHDAGVHLLQLINDVLDMAKLDAAADEVELGAVDANDAVTQAVAMIGPDAALGEIELDVALGDGLPLVEADARRLVQIVLNLLSNAVKFTDADGRVTVGTSRVGDEVHIAVSDTGIGIPTQDLGRLFLPFSQLDGSLDRAYGGSGLGLALSRRLAELFGGRIDVATVEGVGSTFTVVLPMSSAQPAATPVESTRQAATAPDSGGARAEPRPTVLVAEDNEVNRIVVTGYLSVLGFENIAAANGAEAVELTRSQRPDLVLMDIQMPVMNGLEATRILKAERATRDIPIVALTAMAMSGDESRCLSAGCDAYIPKPVDLQELGRVLAALLDRPASGLVAGVNTALDRDVDTPRRTS